MTRRQRRGARWLLACTAGAAAALFAGDSASAASTASFSNGVLTVFGDNNPNSLTVSRATDGGILVNGGAIAIAGGTPTVANTTLIQVFTLGSDDTVQLAETNGPLPKANMFGGSGNDLLIGGAGNDQLFGQTGNDTVEGRGGFDFVFGGSDNDSVIGGDADDQAFGESGNDTLIWNPGDDTDLNEGGAGTDTVRVNGGSGAETFSTTANGTRVRFDRLDPAPFSIDIGTSENLEVNANGGSDFLSSTGNLAALIAIQVDGGAGADTMLGSDGADLLLGGADDDFVDGQQGNDVALAGTGNDTFQWDPGDGSDVVEGQDGTDTMVFNGSGADERFEASANGGRLRFTRDVGNVIMDTSDLEVVKVNAVGGADTTTVNDLSGTDVAEINVGLAGVLGGTAGDGVADTVTVNGTNGADIIDVTGAGTSASVTGLAVRVIVTATDGTNDGLAVNALGANDNVIATTLPTGVIKTTIDGGAGGDQLSGSQDADVLLGGEDADFLFGDDGDDVAFLGAGDDTFQWNPGDGNDTIEGQDGADAMRFFGANVSEEIAVSPNGGRVRFVRNVANVTMDLDDVETIDFRALGGADNIVVNDLSGTDAAQVDVDLGGGDGQNDQITALGTNGNDDVSVTAGAGGPSVLGLAARVDVTGSEAGDGLVVDALAGADLIDASSLPAGVTQLTASGAAGDDVVLGSAGSDALVGGAGDDFVLGGAGDDVLDGGDGVDVLVGDAGNDIFIGGEVVIQNILGERDTEEPGEEAIAAAEWVVGHVQIVDGTSVITVGGRSIKLAGIDLSQVLADATELLASLETPAPVGDFIWVDGNGNGLQDGGEPGMAGVAARLLDANGSVVAEAVSGGDGRYELAPTTPGPFTLEVVIPAGFQLAPVNVGADDAVDSDVDPANVIVGRLETTVRVAVDESASSPGTLDVGLVAVPEATTTTTTTTTTVPTSEVPTSEVPATEVPATEVPTTGVSTTEVPTTEPATTVVPTSEVPTTTAPPTSAPAG